MIDKRYYTQSQENVVFHTSNAGQPDAFASVGWVYQPMDFESNEPFSDVFESAEDALDAAEIWETNQEVTEFYSMLETV